jgi:hypothetical protein
MRRALIGGALSLIVVAVVYYFVGNNSGTPFRGLAQAGAPMFDDNSTIPGGLRAAYSPDGSRLAVLTASGLGLADGGRLRPIAPRGSRVVDFAWFAPASAVVVAEGPVPTGTMAVLGIDGSDKGTITLQPSLSFGDGFGMSVSPDNRTAVVTAVERPALGAEQRYLALVDLATGATRALTGIGGANEQRPIYFGATTIAFTEINADGTERSLSVDTATGAITEVPDGRAVGLVRQGRESKIVTLSGRVLQVSAHRLGQVPDRAEVAAVHPSGAEAVVRETVTEPGGATVGRLRRIALDPPPPVS